jgi:hypothetical protein
MELHLTELLLHHIPVLKLNLLPERQESYEFGLEMSFLRRLGFDVSYTTIKTSTKFYFFIYWIRLCFIECWNYKTKDGSTI